MRRIAFWTRIRGLPAVALLGLLQTAVAAELALVPNQGSGTLSLIDTARDTVIRTIPDSGSLGGKLQAVVAGRVRLLNTHRFQFTRATGSQFQSG